MQTFLPTPNFWTTVKYIDNVRLNKQIVECLQCWNASVFNRTRWKNHPAVRMWIGYEEALIQYGYECYTEWILRWEDGKRGGRECHETGEIISHLYHEYRNFDFSDKITYPPWLGDERLHSSHRASLLAKNYEWYSRFGWKEEPKIQYYWPV